MSTLKRCTPALLLGLLLAVLPVSLTVAQQGSETESQAAGQAPAEETGPGTEPPAPEPEQPAEPPATEAPPEDSLAVSNIPRLAREAANAVRSLREKARPQPSVAAADRNLPNLIEAVETLKKPTAAGELETLSVRRIDDLTQQWERLQRQFQDYGDSLERRAAALEAARRELQQLRTECEAMQATGEQEDLPLELMQRIQSVLTDAGSTETEIRARLDEVLVLQNRTSEQRTVIAAQLESLAEAHQMARRRFLAVDSEPLWRAFSSPVQEVNLLGQVEASWRSDIAVVGQFLETYPQNILAQIIFFLVFAFVLHILNRRNRRWLEADESLATSAQILARPFATALLLVLLTTRLWYPEMPSVILEINRLLFLIPLIGLLARLLDERLRPPLYGLAWLYLLDSVRDLSMEFSLLERLLLFGVAALTLAGAIWLLWSASSIRTYSQSLWWRLATLLMDTAAFLQAVSLVANILGNTTLANLLTFATLSSAYAAVVLAAGSLVLRGLAAALLHTEKMRSFPSVRQYGNLILTRITASFRLLALSLWIYFTLVVFDVWDTVVAGTSTVLGTAWTLGGLSLSLGGVLLFALTIWLSVQASRLVRFILQEDVFPRIHLPRGVAGSASILVNYLILAFGFVIALTAAGIEWSRFALLFGALGVGIGFGLQNIVNNFVSGLVLIFERPIQLGDTIEVGPLIGIVKRIGIRSSTVRTYDGAEVIVPNGDLISKEVVNWTLSDQNKRIEVAVGVKYGTDPTQVLELLEEVARGHERVLEFPSPKAFFEGFGDSSLNFLMRFWTGKFQDWWVIKSEVTVAVNDAIKAAGIEIPFPQRDLHVRSADPAAGRALSGRKVAGGPGSRDDTASPPKN